MTDFMALAKVDAVRGVPYRILGVACANVLYEFLY